MLQGKAAKLWVWVWVQAGSGSSQLISLGLGPQNWTRSKSGSEHSLFQCLVCFVLHCVLISNKQCTNFLMFTGKNRLYSISIPTLVWIFIYFYCLLIIVTEKVVSSSDCSEWNDLSKSARVQSEQDSSVHTWEKQRGHV